MIFSKKQSKPKFQIPIDENGHGTQSWRKKAIYNKFHTDHMVRLFIMMMMVMMMMMMMILTLLDAGVCRKKGGETPPNHTKCYDFKK